MASRYAEVYAGWQRDPHGFWREAAKAIDWIEPPRAIFDPNAGIDGRWFPDATLNACFNCLDRHIRDGRGAQAAVIYDAPVIPFKKAISYDELLDEVQAMAAVLQDFGVGKGDRVIVYLPMLPRAHVAMLACARLGAIHSVVFGGFSATELAARIDDAAPKLILTASCAIEGSRTVPYKPLVDAAIDLATTKPEAVLVWQRPRLQADMIDGRDHDWETLVEAAEGRQVACEPMAATDPLFILYTSGTTGEPKGMVRDVGGTLVALAWSMGALYDVAPGEVFWCTADVGGSIGQSCGVYAPLLIGATTICYEGEPVGTPDAGAFWRVCAEWGVVALFTEPAALGAIRTEDPAGALAKGHDLGKLRALFLAGAHADPLLANWAAEAFGLPVLGQWWQAETGWCIAGEPRGLGPFSAKPGSAGVAMPGYALAVVDEGGRAVPPGTTGRFVVTLPWPPGGRPMPWHDERTDQGVRADAPGAYETSDRGSLDEDGYVVLLGRTGDVIA